MATLGDFKGLLNSLIGVRVLGVRAGYDGDERNIRVNVDIRGVPSKMVPLDGADFVVQHYSVSNLGSVVSAVDVSDDGILVRGGDGRPMLSFDVRDMGPGDMVAYLCGNHNVDRFFVHNEWAYVEVGGESFHLIAGRDDFVGSVKEKGIPRSLYTEFGTEEMKRNIIRWSLHKVKPWVAERVAGEYRVIGDAANESVHELSVRCGIDQVEANRFINWFSNVWSRRVVVSSSEGDEGLLFFDRFIASCGKGVR